MSRANFILITITVAMLAITAGILAGLRQQTIKPVSQEHVTAIKRLAVLARQAKSTSFYEFPVDEAHWQLQNANEDSQRFRAAIDLLFAGETPLSIQTFEALPESFIRSHDVDVQRWLITAYLRLAEEQNCLENHHAESCVVPFTPPAEHAFRPAATKARELLRDRLLQRPDDSEAIWLLNLVEMALGRYPDQPAPPHRIPPDAYSDVPSPVVFKDVAQQMGVDVIGRAGGVVFDDFTGDHFPDLMISDWGIGAPLRFFVNLEGRGFQERTTAAGLNGIWGGLNLVSADYDNDGDLDVLLLRGAWQGPNGEHVNSLLQNQGDGVFLDVTASAGLLTQAPTQTAVFADFNNDGWLDLLIGNESSSMFNRYPSEYYFNDQHGGFVKQPLALKAFVKGLSTGDIDNDGDMDVYVSILGKPNKLFLNQAGVLQETEEHIASTEQSAITFPTWMFDYNNDGWLDIFASGYSSSYDERQLASVANDYLGKPFALTTPILLQNHQGKNFSDMSHDLGLGKALLAMGANYGDINNDGKLDIYLGTGAPDLATLVPNRLFLNTEDRFLDITGSARVGHLQKGHGVAFADFDLDGDLDMYHVLGGAVSADIYPNALYENQGVASDWLQIKLQGITANRSAIGARIRIRKHDGEMIYAQVSTGGSFGASSLVQHTGLGKAPSEVEVSIAWPGSHQYQILGRFTPNQRLHIDQNGNITTW